MLDAVGDAYHQGDLGIEGLQLGALNIIATAGRGVQIGVINSAVVFSGIQIGVLNLIGNAEIPILPIMNAQF